MTFARRIIQIKFQLDIDDFEQGGNVVDVAGYRCSANITHAGATLGTSLDLRIWGMPMSLMNQLSVINKLAYREIGNNIVTVQAGDEQSGISVVFEGTIIEAWADGRNGPGVMFHVSATAAAFDSLKAVPPTSFKGDVDASLAFSGIATQMGLTLRNSGVSARISNPYWPGTLGSQLKQAAECVHAEYFVDEPNKTLEIWPKGQSRGGAAALVSAETGLVGFPAFTQNGVQFTSIYNPSLVFGGLVDIQSQFEPANGLKAIADITHNLDCDMPGGQWFSDVECCLLERERPLK